MTMPTDPKIKEMEDALRGLDYPAPRANWSLRRWQMEHPLRRSAASWSSPRLLIS